MEAQVSPICNCMYGIGDPRCCVNRATEPTSTLDNMHRIVQERDMWRQRARSLEADLDAKSDELEHAERKLAGEWPYNPRLALLERADLYEKDGQPGPLASWGWSDVAKELRAIAELFEERAA